jgi:pimeloyl-ACP methyl ester carboxylesterase
MKSPKHFLLLSLLLATVTTHGQQYLNLSQKRTNLAAQLRNLGPLAPTNWPSSLATFSGNWGFVDQNYSLFFVGNYGYHFLTQDPGPPVVSYYDYKYQGTGNWAASDRSWFNHPNAMFATDFGIGLPAVPAGQSVNYSFSLEPDNYNVAGLRYESVFVVTGLSGQNLTGYTVNRGQTVNTTIPFSTSRTFDLGQNVEAPAFRITDFSFGRFWNYPVDTRLPQPQKTWRQSQHAFLVSAINQVTTNVCFVEEGVYRPGFTLATGLTAPALKTHLQLYFDKAYRADPLTANVPRLSATNWNGVGKINTTTAVQTGLINAGYYFQPNEFGLAILTSDVLENGFYGELPVFTFAPLVDANRDGLINTNDVTSAVSPHRFWINNDADRAHYEAHNLWDELDLEVGGTNITDAAFVKTKHRIPSLRDLEDYDRLHIRGLDTLGRFSPPGTTVTLSWKSILSGNPGIYVFKAAETNGGGQYLLDAAVAASQISPTTYPPAPTEPGASPLKLGEVIGSTAVTLVSDSFQADTDFFIYCGTSRGVGELAVTVKRGTDVIGQASVFLQLREPREFFERWTLGDGNGTEPATTPVFDASGPGGLGQQFFDNPATPQPYIVFVHGWNMAPWEKATFGETAFKRLYWQGYTNRFGILRWPTGYGFSDDLLANPGPVFDPTHYDRSEFVAWKSGAGFRNHLVSLNQRYPGKVYLLAHSMGNVVAGEALALHAEKHSGGQVVNTYVASQAAIPLQAYNPNPSGAYQLSFVYSHPKIPGSGLFDYESHTANVYPGWLATNRVACATRINFFNPNDYALAMSAWGYNQILKPNNIGGTTFYEYRRRSTVLPGPGAPAGSAPQFTIPSPARRGLTPPFIQQMAGFFRAVEQVGIGQYTLRNLDWEYTLKDMYEVMSFASEARTVALGTVNDANAMEELVNLASVWPPDTETDSEYGVYARHKWHSGQFRANNMKQRFYWQTLLSAQGFDIP